MAPFFVPSASAISSIFHMKIRDIPAWLVAALAMDEVHHMLTEPLLQEWFGYYPSEAWTVPIKEASMGLQTDLKKIRVDPVRKMAVWRLFHHGIIGAPSRKILTVEEYADIWNVAFSPEQHLLQPSSAVPVTDQQIVSFCALRPIGPRLVASIPKKKRRAA